MPNPASDTAPTAPTAPAAGASDLDLDAGLAEIMGKPKAADPEPAKEPAAAPPKPDPEPAKDEPPADDVPLDAAAKKRLEVDQARDRKHKEAVAKELASIETAKQHLETEWKPRIERAEAYEAAKGTGVNGLLNALDHFGVTDAKSLETLARAAWARGPGKDDPKAQAAAAATLDRHSSSSEMAEMRKELAAMKSERAAERQAATTKEAVDKYLGTVTAEVPKVDAPLVKRLAEKAPDRVRARLLAVATDMAEPGMPAPTPAEVIAELEKRERADLEDRGLDPRSFLAPAAAAPVAGKAPARTLGQSSAPTTAPSDRPKTKRELDAELDAGLTTILRSGRV